MTFPRASGVLLHPTSLPGDFGIGDLGPKAFEFVDFLVQSGQTYWQILPLGPTGYGDSPYQCFSAFAGNPLLISPERLFEEGLLSEPPAVADGLTQSGNTDARKIDFAAVYEWKNTILPEAYKNFHATTSVDLRGKFEKFAQENAAWLDDYSLYKAIKASQGQKAWYQWPDPLKLRNPEMLENEAKRLYEEIQAERFYQFLFYSQWLELKRYANRNGVKIVGDMPIFIALDSSDVWRNSDKFKLNSDGSPKVVAGVPPDYFSKTGQLWGNPIYDWDAMQQDGFRWWIDRVKSTLCTVDVVRIDHFRGFAASWEVPADEETAENGRWVEVPGEDLFKTINRELGDLPFWAEDLGVITPDVENLRDSFGLPGMRILQFAFGGDAQNHDLPHNYVSNCVAYTGTHDNDTTVGWWLSQAGAGSTRDAAEISRERQYCLEYLASDGHKVHWDFIRSVWASVANTAITPMQDILGIGTDARMNLPGSTDGNWKWRMDKNALSDEIIKRLKKLTEIYGRSK
ncbi:MAG: 4-alpha-glucanotransferase [Pyrinomonadaceae bacterium]